jgi:hypothetical protein
MKKFFLGFLLLSTASLSWGESSTTTFFCEAKSRAQSKEDGEIFQFAPSSKVQVEIQKDHALLSWAGVASNPNLTVNKYIVTSFLNEGQYFAVDAKMERDSTRLFTIKRDIDGGDYLAALASASGGFGSVQSLDCTKF